MSEYADRDQPQLMDNCVALAANKEQRAWHAMFLCQLCLVSPCPSMHSMAATSQQTWRPLAICKNVSGDKGAFR